MTNSKVKQLLSITFAAFLLIACTSGELYTLEYKAETGASYSQKALVYMKINLIGNNTPFTVDFTLDMKLHENIIGNENDLITSDTYIDEAILTLKFPNNSILLNSNTNDSIANLLHPDPIIKTITGIPYTASINKQGKVLSIKGFNQITDRILNVLDPNFDPLAVQQLSVLLKQSLTDENILTLFEDVPAAFPDKPVKVGSSWNTKKAKKKEDIKKTENTTLTSVSENIATLTTTSTHEGDALPTNLNNNLKSFKAESNSISKFDINAGRTISAENTLKADGEMELLGKTYPFTLDIKITVTE